MSFSINDDRFQRHLKLNISLAKLENDMLVQRKGYKKHYTSVQDSLKEAIEEGRAELI